MRARNDSATGNLFAARGDASRRPSVVALVPRMLAALAGRGWTSAAILCLELGTDARSLREAANRSKGRIIGHQRGYMTTATATIEDVQRVERRLLSQANRMRIRVLEIQRIRHGSASNGGAA